MTNATTSAFSSPRRILGRAASPPTWAWYEQIPYDDEDEDDDSSNSESDDYCDQDDESDSHPAAESRNSMSMDGPVEQPPVNEDGPDSHPAQSQPIDIAFVRDVKGKQRDVDPPVLQDKQPERQPRRKRARESTQVFRPILTIHRSHGFVWNQDLFVPPYLKDRYVASISPPNASGFSASSSTTSSLLATPMADYEPVEIRVNQGDLDRIIP